MFLFAIVLFSVGFSEYSISDKSLDMNGFLVRVNTEGFGQIARTDGEDLKFNDEYPVQSSVDHIADGTKLLIGAKAADGWKFVKWTMNGKDFSDEAVIRYIIHEDVEFVAVFDIEIE